MTLLAGQGLFDVLSSSDLLSVEGPARHLATADVVASLLTVAVAPTALWGRNRLLRRALLAAFGTQLAVAALRTVGSVQLYGDGWVSGAATAGAGLLGYAVAPTAGLLLARSEPARRWFSGTGQDAAPDGVVGVAGPRPAAVAAPGPAVAACVLAGSLAVLSLPGALFTALATSSFAALDDALYDQSVVVLLWEFACPAPLVTGAVLLFHGLDRSVLLGGAAVVVGISGWWVWVGAAEGSGLGGVLFSFLALLFAGPAVTAAVLALQPSVGSFLRTGRRTPPQG